MVAIIMDIIIVISKFYLKYIYLNINKVKYQRY